MRRKLGGLKKETKVGIAIVAAILGIALLAELYRRSPASAGRPLTMEEFQAASEVSTRENIEAIFGRGVDIDNAHTRDIRKFRNFSEDVEFVRWRNADEGGTFHYILIQDGEIIERHSEYVD